MTGCILYIFIKTESVNIKEYRTTGLMFIKSEIFYTTNPPNQLIMTLLNSLYKIN